jgi:hypothetical protein
MDPIWKENKFKGRFWKFRKSNMKDKHKNKKEEKISLTTS